MDKAQLVLLLLAAMGALLAAMGALIAAIFTWFAAQATKTASRGATLLSCLQNYIDIMKDRRKAEEEESSLSVEEFYRELFDLHWSEFHLWRDDVISDNVMLAWARVRKRNFDEDKAISTKDGKTVTYRNCWDKLKNINYFEIDDPFVKFMKKVHAGEITTIKELTEYKKQLKKGSTK